MSAWLKTVVFRILIFRFTLTGGAGVIFFFFAEPAAPRFSNEVNPNLVGCRLHIVHEIKACLECAKLVYAYYVTFVVLQRNTCCPAPLASFSPSVHGVN